MREAQAPAAPESWGQRWETALASLRRRWHDPRFWFVQAMVVGITALHYAVEAFPVDESISTIHHIPVIVYLIPVVYASLHYGWEGGVLTALWSGLLTVPSMTVSHRSDFHWAGELGQVAVTLAVGAVLAWRVKLESELRQRAERTSAELTVSEEKYRSIFENAGDPILVCDSGGLIAAVNEAAAVMTGYAPAELRGMPVERLFGREGAELLLATSGWERRGRLRLVLTRSDSSTALVDAALTALGSNGEPAAVQAVLRDVTEEERRHEEMRNYARAVTRAQEEERTRIARELHDELGQALTGMVMNLEAAQEGLDKKSEAPLRRMERAKSLAVHSIDSIRQLILDLRPAALDDLGLVAALRAFAESRLGESGIALTLETARLKDRLPAPVETSVFRVVQEAVTNIVRHAQAGAVRIHLERTGDRVVLLVEDDGRGFDIGEAMNSPDRARKLGLLGMEERISLLNGSLSVQSAPGQGTRVRAEIPLLEEGGSP